MLSISCSNRLLYQFYPEISLISQIVFLLKSHNGYVQSSLKLFGGKLETFFVICAYLSSKYKGKNFAWIVMELMDINNKTIGKSNRT